MRMAARRGPGGPPPPPVSQKPLSFDTSSEEEESDDEEHESSSSDGMGDEEDEINGDSDGLSEVFGPGADSSIDEGDAFDPEFAATRINSDSDVNSILSGESSMPGSGAQPSYRARPRLSPVSEHRRRAGTRGNQPVGLNLAPPPKVEADKRTGSGGMTRTRSDNSQTKHAPSPSNGSLNSELMFARKKVSPPKSQQSSLSSMLALSTGSTNPFSELYASISGRGQVVSSTINVYFPHATAPAGKPMTLNIRKDATVEEVIGYALWNYWEEGWLPKLDAEDGWPDSDPKRREQRLSAVGWILKIAEDDGEPDDDFPRKFSRYVQKSILKRYCSAGSDGKTRKVRLRCLRDPGGKCKPKYVITSVCKCLAHSFPVQQNEILESKIQRRPSRIMRSKKSDVSSNKPAANNAQLTVGKGDAAASSSFATPGLGSAPLSTSLGPSSGQGPQMFLRIRVENDAHISTTIPVYGFIRFCVAFGLIFP